jgi:hypothetical protein
MSKVILTIFAVLALAPSQVHATSRTTCTNWEDGNYSVEIDGVTHNCKNKRTCTTVETDPDGQCRKVFGCHTTIEVQYATCTKAISNPASGVHGGTRGVFDPGTSGKPKPPFSAPKGGLAP